MQDPNSPPNPNVNANADIPVDNTPPAPQIPGEPMPSAQNPIAPAQAAPPQQTLAPTQPPGAPPKPKRKIPKKTVLLIAVFVLGIFILVFVAVKIIPSTLKLFGTKGEITWWSLTQDEGILSSSIEACQEKMPNIKVNVIKQSEQDYRERLVNAQARGEGPDIFEFHNTWVPMLVSELDVLPSSVMSSTEFAQAFYPVIVSDLSTKDGIVGIPLGFDALTLFVNDDIFAAAGKVPPETWDELRVVASEITTRDDRGLIIQSGVALGTTENIEHWEEILGLMMVQNGVNLSNPSGSLAEDALRFYSVFSKTDDVWDETLPPSVVAFANGKVAMIFAPSWRAADIIKQNPNLRFRAVPLPQLRKDDPSAPDTSYATYWSQGVWRRSAENEAAWTLLSCLSERESLERIYANESSLNNFGKPFPRRDMGLLVKDHPVLGSIISLAPNAESWYLASDTNDGQTGLNTQLSEVYKEALGEMNKGRPVPRIVEEAANQVVIIFSQYGIR